MDGRPRGRDGRAALRHRFRGRGAHPLFAERRAGRRQQGAARADAAALHRRPRRSSSTPCATRSTPARSSRTRRASCSSARPSKLYNWNLNFGDIASIWRAGCIIRAQFLNRITEAYRQNPGLKNLVLAPFFRDMLVEHAGELAQGGQRRHRARRRGARLQRGALVLR